jgi:preprotein translocase SecF subunit
MALSKHLSLNPKLDFMGARMWFFGIALTIVLGSFALVAFKGLNFGVDFRGGIAIEVQTDGPADLDQMRSDLNALDLGGVTLVTFGDPDVVLINLPAQEGGEDAQKGAIEAVKAALGDRVVEYRRTEAVGPKVGDELRTGGIVATVLSLLGIAVYVWIRFDLSYGLASLVALAHDVIGVVGFYALVGYEFDLTTLGAVLTVAGYSINDTVVIYDRVREELRRYKTLPIPEVLNKAINATLTRTFLTSFTTLLSLIGLYAFGGEVIRGFSAGIIIGIVLGTYSSWGVSVPLLSYTRLRRRKEDATPAKPAVPAKGKEA